MVGSRGLRVDGVSGASGRSALVVDRRSLSAVLERGPRALPSSVPIVVDDPELTAAERLEWESRLTVLYNECGCHAGKVGLVGAIPVLVAMFLWSPAGIAPLEPRGVVLTLSLPLGGAVLGKAVGLTRGRIRLRRAISDLAALLHERSAARLAGDDGD